MRTATNQEEWYKRSKKKVRYVKGPRGAVNAGPDRALGGIEVDDQIRAASMQEAFKYFKQVIMKYANRMKGKSH